MTDIETLHHVLHEEIGLYKEIIEINAIKKRFIIRDEHDSLKKIIEEEDRYAEKILAVVEKRNTLIQSLCEERGISRPNLTGFAASLDESSGTVFIRLRDRVIQCITQIVEATNRNTALIQTKMEIIEAIFTNLKRKRSLTYTKEGHMEMEKGVPFPVRKGFLI